MAVLSRTGFPHADFILHMLYTPTVMVMPAISFVRALKYSIIGTAVAEKIKPAPDIPWARLVDRMVRS